MRHPKWALVITMNKKVEKDHKVEAVFTKVTDTPTTETPSGGGCSAGFGALALLALAPMMLRRKK